MRRDRPYRFSMVGISHFRADGTAAAVVEFALLLPVYLLLVLGMIAYGIYFGAAHSVQQLAADAARVAVAGLTADERAALVTAFVKANGPSYVLIDPEKLAVAPEQSPADPAQYNVTLSYDASALPIWNLYPPIPLPGKTIMYRSTVRQGGI
ncbi:TadE/TadG family type IV pilus assembly protein [Pelagibacterium xiamenense]|uniref:TadE/TadG family type IV pilus assembly protein n=1 Tax=Pelagibacterium xiamenense TaxID=2901140 RepID=UPI001E643CC2|nr:TadE/TadG family type IV pilus assembly protein [Pelagibacterium xiamenense]MCD7058564.1 pilus assembly protein [Pelagibacterium xiamenense]